VVPWDQVYDYMHIETGVTDGMEVEAYGYGSSTAMTMQADGGQSFTPRRLNDNVDDGFIAQEEIDEIFRRTYGSNERAKKGWEGRKKKTPTPYMGQTTSYKPAPKHNAEEYLLVDGYNIIFAWEDLKELAEVNIDAARDRLADVLCNYQGYKRCHVILVFDAYRVKNHAETVIPYHNIYIVYTKEAETADNYIARTAARMEGQYKVTVATSDALVQMIIWGKSAVRLSAQGLREEVEKQGQDLKETYLKGSGSLGNTVL